VRLSDEVALESLLARDTPLSDIAAVGREEGLELGRDAGKVREAALAALGTVGEEADHGHPSGGRSEVDAVSLCPLKRTEDGGELLCPAHRGS
jgi:hypothetical protein